MIQPSKIKIQEQIKLVGDVFHPLIIALENYEAFLERQRTGQDSALLQVAAHTTGDTSDYSEESMNNQNFLFRMMRTQCVILHNQTVFDDSSIAETSNKFFLEDLFEWYGGREDSIPYNEVDAFAYPIICSLCQHVKTPDLIRDIIEQYVKSLPKKEPTQKDIERGLQKFILSSHNINERYHSSDDEIFDVRHHNRGTVRDGYERLFLAFVTLFDDDVPAKTLCRIVQKYIPELFNECSAISETAVDELLFQKKKKEKDDTIIKDVLNKTADEEMQSVMDKLKELYEVLKTMFDK